MLIYAGERRAAAAAAKIRRPHWRKMTRKTRDAGRNVGRSGTTVPNIVCPRLPDDAIVVAVVVS
jgi:hypothetical protein